MMESKFPTKEIYKGKFICQKEESFNHYNRNQ